MIVGYKFCNVVYPFFSCTSARGDILLLTHKYMVIIIIVFDVCFENSDVYLQFSYGHLTFVCWFVFLEYLFL